jgi:transcriptional regulator with XRE-family HTH domain
MTTPEAIRHMRKRLGKNQAQLAQILRCRQDTVSRYERGRLAPSPIVLVNLLSLADPEEKAAFKGQLAEYSRRGLISPTVEGFTEAVRTLRAEIQLSWELMDLVPEAKRGAPGFGHFIPAVAHIIEECAAVDPSIPEILQLWAAHHEKPQTTVLLRDALGYLRNALWREFISNEKPPQA